MTHLTPAFAWQIVTEFVQDPGLRRHMWAVGSAMGWYAGHFGLDQAGQDRWTAIGRLHDFDWEIHSNLDQHPLEGAPILRKRGVDEAAIRTILSHYSAGTGVPRQEPIDFALLACDEITGLIIAVSLVRPSRDIRDVRLRSIRKKWKDRRFAAGVDREHVVAVTTDFSEACFGGQLQLWTHIDNILSAMQAEAAPLELDGRLAG